MALNAEKDWRRISGFEKVVDVISGVKFQDGIVVVPDEGDSNHQQQIAAAFNLKRACVGGCISELGAGVCSKQAFVANFVDALAQLYI